jgi:glycosyltransferase involved in cell wall biosynthesis
VKDGETGFTIFSFNPEDYAEKVKLLLKDNNLRWKLGENARKKILSQFTWDKVTDKIINGIQNHFDNIC